MNEEEASALSKIKRGVWCTELEIVRLPKEPEAEVIFVFDFIPAEAVIGWKKS